MKDSTRLSATDILAMPPSFIPSLVKVCLNDIARLSGSACQRDRSDIVEARRVLGILGY